MVLDSEPGRAVVNLRIIRYNGEGVLPGRVAQGLSVVMERRIDAGVQVWEVDTKKCRFTLRGHQDIVHGVGINGAHIVSGSSDRMIKVLHARGVVNSV